MSIKKASRIERLLARMADNILYAIPLSMLNNESFFSNLSGMMGAGILACIAVIQIGLLTSNGQTIGKKMLSIKIVEHTTGKNGGFIPNVILRTACNMILAFIPLYVIIDVLYIFRKDERCIHDVIAKTMVVKS